MNQWIIFILGSTAAMTITYQALRTGRLFLFALGPAFFSAVFLLNNPAVLLMLIIALMRSGLTLPGLPAQLNLVEVLQLYFALIGIATFCLHKGNAFRNYMPINILVLIFMGIMALVIAIRGAGFQILGDMNWGGGRYVELLIGCLFFLFIHTVDLTAKQIKQACIFMVLMSFIPSISEFIFVLSKGKIYYQYSFVTLGANNVDALLSFATGSDLVRFKSARSASIAFLQLALLFQFTGKFTRFFKWIFLALSLAFAAISGHRIAVLILIGNYWVFNYFLRMKDGLHRKFLYISVMVALFMIPFVYLVTPFLPHAMQRSLTFLPGVKVDEAVMRNAASTVNWRLDLWLDALEEIPEHLIIGKGYTYPAYATEQIEGGFNLMKHHEWALITSNYHNGPLSLLIGFGIPGFIIGNFIILYSVIRLYEFTKTEWQDSFLRRLFILFYADVIVKILMFYFIFGYVPHDFYYLLMRFGLIELILRTAELQGKVNKEAEQGVLLGQEKLPV